MSEREYARVYFEVIDDEKFAGITLAEFGGWVRLLMVADAAWPASGFLPGERVVPRRIVADLVRREIVDTLPGGRFRIHGLDAERGRRKESAQRGAGKRWHGDPNAMQTHSERNAVPVRTNMPSRAEQSKAEQSTPRAVDAAWETASGRTLLASGNYAITYIDDATSRHGERDVVAAIARARSGFPHVPESNVLAAAVRNILDPFKDAKAIDAEMREQAEAARSRRGTDNTKRQIHGSGFHADTPDPLCPECAGRVA